MRVCNFSVKFHRGKGTWSGAISFDSNLSCSWTSRRRSWEGTWGISVSSSSQCSSLSGLFFPFLVCFRASSEPPILMIYQVFYKPKMSRHIHWRVHFLVISHRLGASITLNILAQHLKDKNKLPSRSSMLSELRLNSRRYDFANCSL